MLTRLLVLFGLGLATASPAAAWWEFGHETVARIAYANVAPSTRNAIDRLLAREKLLDTPTCPARTLPQASVWADCIKGLKDRFSYASSWHYQNVDICRPFDLKAACADGNCVSAQIERNAKLLADKALPVRERVMALAFLTHFVGDLHNPMHAGSNNDLGGNRVPLTYGIVGGRINLHSAWDGYLAERAITSPPGSAALLRPTDKATLAAGSVEDWSRENWQLSRDHAYTTARNGRPCEPIAERAHLSDAEIEALVPVVRLQVQRGGVRLARLLDEALAR